MKEENCMNGVSVSVSKSDNRYFVRLSTPMASNTEQIAVPELTGSQSAELVDIALKYHLSERERIEVVETIRSAMYRDKANARAVELAKKHNVNDSDVSLDLYYLKNGEMRATDDFFGWDESEE